MIQRVTNENCNRIQAFLFCIFLFLKKIARMCIYILQGRISTLDVNVVN